MSGDNNALVPDVISLGVIAFVCFQTLERLHGLIKAKRVEVLEHFILEVAMETVQARIRVLNNLSTQWTAHAYQRD